MAKETCTSFLDYFQLNLAHLLQNPSSISDMMTTASSKIEILQYLCVRSAG